jgi:hypothetical protein
MYFSSTVLALTRRKEEKLGPSVIILDSAVDRLLPMKPYCMRKHFRSFALHQIGEHATQPIARFWGRRALLLLNQIGSHAASPPLQDASALAREDRFAGSQHPAQTPQINPSPAAPKTHTQARSTAESRIISRLFE